MLKGTLDDFTLADIFRLMSLARRTGKLEVVRSAGQGKVFVKEGEVYYAESSLAREPLGQKLIRAGALTESALMKALDENAAGGKRVGEILVDSGAISYEQLQKALQQQIEDAVFDLLRWDLGEFTWEPGVLADVEVNIAVSVENLVIEASRRLDELEVIGRKIPSVQSLLRMAHTPPEGAAEINITPEEWRMLVLVDGTRSVHDIALQVGVDDFTALRSLYGLVSAGLAEVEEGRDSIDAVGKPGERVAGFTSDPDRPTATVAAEPAEEAPHQVEATDETPAVAVAAVEPEIEPVVETEPEPEPEPEPVVAEEFVDQVFNSVEEADEGLFQAEADETPDAVDEMAEDDQEADAPEEPAAVAEADEATSQEDESVEAFDEPAPEEITTSVPDDGSDPFLNDLLGGPPSSAPPASTPPPAPPAPAEQPDAPEEQPSEAGSSPQVDRAAAVRELAGLFDDDRPRNKPTGSAARSETDAGGEDERRRVEDDDSINKGLIGRLIDGVKGM